MHVTPENEVHIDRTYIPQTFMRIRKNVTHLCKCTVINSHPLNYIVYCGT